MQTAKAKPVAVEGDEVKVVREGLVLKQTLKNGKAKGWKVGNQYASAWRKNPMMLPELAVPN